MTSQAAKTISGVAGTAVTVYRFVQRATDDGQYDHAGAQGRVDGVSFETVAAGDELPLAIPNGAIVEIELGATLARNAKVASAADGRAIAAVSGAGNFSAGLLLEGGDAGDVVPMQFIVDEDQVA